MKKPQTFTLDEKLIEPLEKAKKKQRRSKSQIVENAVAKDLKVKI